MTPIEWLYPITLLALFGLIFWLVMDRGRLLELNATSRWKSVDALQKAYVRLLMDHGPNRHTTEGQALLCLLRDTIAAATRQDVQTVQESCEEQAAIARAKGGPR